MHSTYIYNLLKIKVPSSMPDLCSLPSVLEGSTEMCSDYALDQCLRCSDLLTPAYREHMRGKKLSAVTTA